MQFKWLRQLIESPYASLVAAMGLAAVIRIYLLWQYDCISSDGVKYIKAAKDFYAGDISAGLASVYPPLYPLSSLPYIRWLAIGSLPDRSVDSSGCVCFDADFRPVPKDLRQ